MATTVTLKLNKPAHQFQAGESTGFGIRGGVQYYDRETKQKEWTNYEAVVFAKAPAQIQFYQGALVEGAIIEVTGKQCKIRKFEGQNGLSLSIELIDASLGLVHNAQQAVPAPAYVQQQVQQPPQYQQQPPQMAPQAPQQMAPGMAPPPAGLDDDIPFASVDSRL